MKKILIIGLGNFGYAILKHFDVKNNGEYKLSAWDRNKHIIESLRQNRKHPNLFPDVEVSSSITFSTQLSEIIKNSNYVIFAISSSAYSHVLKNIRIKIPENAIIINTAKALDESGKRFSEITKEILEKKNYTYAVFAGGTIASDLFKKEPLGIDIACSNEQRLQELSHLFNSYNLSVYPTTDVVGVEYAAAFKNIVSILAGLIRGMGYSYGSETHVISRAADELADLTVKQLGGQPKTFSMGSQAWGNDLWMSCTGKTRNKEFGERIGKGEKIDEVLKHMKQEGKTVEGIQTINVLNKIADVSKYPLLNYLNTFFNENGDLKMIEKIIFNHTC